MLKGNTPRFRLGMARCRVGSRPRDGWLNPLAPTNQLPKPRSAVGCRLRAVLLYDHRWPSRGQQDDDASGACDRCGSGPSTNRTRRVKAEPLAGAPVTPWQGAFGCSATSGLLQADGVNHSRRRGSIAPASGLSAIRIAQDVFHVDVCAGPTSSVRTELPISRETGTSLRPRGSTSIIRWPIRTRDLPPNRASVGPWTRLALSR